MTYNDTLRNRQLSEFMDGNDPALVCDDEVDGLPNGPLRQEALRLRTEIRELRQSIIPYHTRVLEKYGYNEHTSNQLCDANKQYLYKCNALKELMRRR